MRFCWPLLVIVVVVSGINSLSNAHAQHVLQPSMYWSSTAPPGGHRSQGQSGTLHSHYRLQTPAPLLSPAFTLSSKCSLYALSGRGKIDQTISPLKKTSFCKNGATCTYKPSSSSCSPQNTIPMSRSLISISKLSYNDQHKRGERRLGAQPNLDANGCGCVKGVP